ncbi:uncharacterized protein LOC131363900 [Hemibagrus wyckioides]|uniref:uncharacterized protein LOC131363900 n=1 Tax=Hemibagrus wyckioides TaxID=337641 RepID=UPI00266D7CF7|nr:uncharacterized protein LOC131363900 [Hemibagrus wyckioides]
MSIPDNPEGEKEISEDTMKISSSSTVVLMDLDTETPMHIPLASCPSPQERGVGFMNSIKRCSTSFPPEGGPTSPKKEKNSNESCEIKTAPSTNPERTEGQKNKVEWNFINVNNYTDCIKMSDKEVLDHIKQNIKKTSNYQKKKFKKLFLQMLKKEKRKKSLFMGKKYRQRAFAILKLNNKSNNKEKTEVIPPFYPKRKRHSEDFIIEEIKERNDISEVWIYTTNSPCLGRKPNPPCMSKLINFAKSHLIKIYIGFSNYYIFNKNMYRFIQNQEDDETRNWNSDHKFQVQFNVREFKYNCEENKKIKDNNLITAAYNIIMNILSKYSGLEKTYKDWHQTGSETLAELESTLREEMKKRREMKIKDNCLTATCKIIMNIPSKYLGLEKMYKDWHQTGSEILAELESKLREEMERREMMESSDEEFSEITDECKKWWTLSIDENLNRHVVPSILEKIHDFCPNLEFFQVDLEDCFNLANEE